jgi:hypothetical protein
MNLTRGRLAGAVRFAGVALVLAAFVGSLTIAGSTARAEEPAAYQPENQAASNQLECSIRLRQLAMFVHFHARQHDGEIPPDLAATLDTMLEYRKVGDASVAAVIRERYLSPGRGISVPEKAEAAWVNEHSSYAYLGRPGVLLSDVMDWDLAIAYLKLDQGYPTAVTPQNPEGELINVAFLDSSVQALTRAQAMERIAEAEAVYEALRRGTALPDRQQALWDMRKLGEAFNAYMAAHDGVLPPDLGSLLEYVPMHERLETPRQRAALFLSINARKNTHVPEEPTPEWVNRNASYIYLAQGDEPLRPQQMEDPRLLLLHGRLDDELRQTKRGREERVIPALALPGYGELPPRDTVAELAEETRQVVDAIHKGRPLPDYQHARRDLRLIREAVLAYAAANDGRLPPTLGAAVDYLPAAAGEGSSRGRLFLSPAAERSRGEPPEAITPEWIDAHASYIYLGKPGLTTRSIKQPGMPIIVMLHGPLNEPYEVRFAHGPDRVVPYAYLESPIQATGIKWLQEQIDEAQQAIAKLLQQPEK